MQDTISFPLLLDIRKKSVTPHKKKSPICPINFAIVVPFRDQPQQKRQQQLDRFIPYMHNFLKRLGGNYQHHIIVVEQVQDGRKFNRGQLLNIGFELAVERDCQHCIFHDVDVLPSYDLLDYYATTPTMPLHLGAIWSKYAHLEFFFGGICSFSVADYKKINGFPNDYWGWGGEDEELYLRVLDQQMTVQKPLYGTYEEMIHKHAKEIVGMVNKQRYAQIIQRVEQPNTTGLSTLEFQQFSLKQAFKEYNTFIYQTSFKS